MHQQEAFLRLIAEYELPLRRLARFYRPGHDEDLFQEIALALWRAIPRFRAESSERTWLYRIAHNVAITQVTRERRREHREVPIERRDSHAPGALPDEALAESDQRRQLEDAIRELSPLDRHVVLLHLEGLSHAEIEDVCGLSAAAIATRLSRARQALAASIRAKEARR